MKLLSCFFSTHFAQHVTFHIEQTSWKIYGIKRSHILEVVQAKTQACKLGAKNRGRLALAHIKHRGYT